jgi:hypothetical protein
LDFSAEAIQLLRQYRAPADVIGTGIDTLSATVEYTFSRRRTLLGGRPFSFEAEIQRVQFQ